MHHLAGNAWRDGNYGNYETNGMGNAGEPQEVFELKQGMFLFQSLPSKLNKPILAAGGEP